MSHDEAIKLLELARSGIHVNRHLIHEALIASGSISRNDDEYWNPTARIIPAGKWKLEPKAPATWLDGLITT